MNGEFPVDPLEIRKFFLNPSVTDNYVIEWKEPDKEGLMKFLCKEHDFSENRVEKAIRRLEKAMRQIRTQSSLEEWFS